MIPCADGWLSNRARWKRMWWDNKVLEFARGTSGVNNSVGA